LAVDLLQVAKPAFDFDTLDCGKGVLSPSGYYVDLEEIPVPLRRGMGLEWKLDVLIVGGELFHVHGSEGRSFVDVDPELHHSLFRVLALGEFDHRPDDLFLVGAVAAFLGVVTENPCIGLKTRFERSKAGIEPLCSSLRNFAELRSSNAVT
jgi:hypothetical protein